MNYFQTTSDARDIYRSNSASGSLNLTGTAVPGNLGDLMRNAVAVRTTFIAPVVTRATNQHGFFNITDTSSPAV